MRTEMLSHALTRRRFTQLSGMAAGALAIPEAIRAATTPDVSLVIAPYTLEASPKHHIKTLAYNGQIPGPLFRMREGRQQAVEIRNLSDQPEVVHWHGLFLPPAIDGAMEEGTPMIAAGASTRYTMTPSPAGFRWYHTHTFAGKNLTRAQFGGLHGFLLVEPRDNPAPYDREVFLALHDWRGQFLGGDDGYMSPVYDVTTINGKMLGFGDPIKVKQGERVMMHILNSSPTETHWISLSGHSFKVIALDGNEVREPQTVTMLRLAPAERVSAIVEMNHPGVWILGEVRKHIQATGMGIVVEYANSTGKAVWTQPEELIWSYRMFAKADETVPGAAAKTLELVFDSRFQGHGNEELWRINGLPYPQNSTPEHSPLLRAGERYRLVLKNKSMDDHPMHLHRHTFEIRRLEDGAAIAGLRKDVVLVQAGKTVEVEFVADNPGDTLFHCHQQDHMDRGFMMVFKYA
ncbi:Multicopper oxidase with three cupredoxin domains (includes cell division protein FtsP and spore coat protein CotA) [Granulicella rosea]|uniref:Multicopper oxidase with three cupredoxin domains (Includes cell division protein FtsP and spore coat protein CotA) n=1 Tax=Granulicella rosea TaxID=474952 RepID=A0A239HLZ2_9BACT|nr:multicopper oxidase family protein [Granulicella rosea]SNS81863.1 Multicopper oxidase with three cupredoxin domains (includes cell division protein FtsP and spore coat protein CotA) [Granulicella rosea]